MTEAPIFAHAPHPTAQFIVEMDASLQATGAALYQCPLPELKQVIAYSSHKLQLSEKLYPPHERERLAVVKALNEWRHYLLGHTFDLYSDNEAITCFLKQPFLTPRQARWVNSSQSTISTFITYLERTILQLTHSAVAQILSLPTTFHHFLRKNSNCSAHARCKTRSIDLTFCACLTIIHPYLPCTL